MKQVNRIARYLAIGASLATAVAQTPEGRAAFQNRCAVCHGTDARGGEHAPSIINQVRRRNDEQLTTLLKQGVPQTGMPAFNDTPEPELRSIVAFLRTLARPRPGENDKPEKISLVGGKEVEGIVVGRNAREMQLRSADGKVHLLRKSGEQWREVTSQSDWSSLHGCLSGNRYTAMTQITKANVWHLAVKWVYALPNAARLQGTPQVLRRHHVRHQHQYGHCARCR